MEPSIPLHAEGFANVVVKVGKGSTVILPVEVTVPQPPVKVTV